jgi:hypothetical protein
MRKVKSVKCELCGYTISSNNIKKHQKYCDGLGPKNSILRKEKQKLEGKGQEWLKGKKYEEVYGKEKAKEIRKKISLNGKGKIKGRALTEEKELQRRKKISISMKGNKNGATSFRHRKIEYNDIIFKSSWEVKVAQFLDKNKIKWEYEDKSYSLSNTRSYTPDFSIYEKGTFIKNIEVKGYWRKENKEKFSEFKNLYPDIIIEIWDKKILLEKNILT